MTLLQPSKWQDFASPTPAMMDALKNACPCSASLQPCGVGWDAVVIAPLQRGLAALDALELPTTSGYAVTADYKACKLVVQVRENSGWQCAGPPGVRVLRLGSFVLLPEDGAGTIRAARLGTSSGGNIYLDAIHLREALTQRV